jgi:hypothetical protein
MKCERYIPFQLQLTNVNTILVRSYAFRRRGIELEICFPVAIAHNTNRLCMEGIFAQYFQLSLHLTLLDFDKHVAWMAGQNSRGCGISVEISTRFEVTVFVI